MTSLDVIGISSIVSSINVQLLTRGITFGINLGVARFVDPTVFGTAHISFGLFETLALCFLKEGFRRTALRGESNNTNPQSNSQKENHAIHQSNVNVSVLASIGTIFTTFLLAIIWLFFFSPPSTEGVGISASSYFSNVLVWYRISIVFISIGVVLQALAEPAVIRCLLQQRVAERAKIEGYATIARTVTTPLVLYCFSSFLGPLEGAERLSIGLISFAASHVVFGLIWLLAFWNRLDNSNSFIDVKPPSVNPITGWSIKTLYMMPIQFLTDHSYLSKQHRQLLPSFLILAGEKVLLNEAERLALVLVFSPDAWGIYALVTNLGSLVCRLIFAPIEEVAAVVFSASTPDAGESTQKSASAEADTAVKCNHESVSDLLTKVSSTLQLPLLGLYVGCEGLIGLCAVALGPPVSGAVLFFLYGNKWAAMGCHWILQRYCIHLFALSLNGILEAYMYSRASATWLLRLQWIHAIVWLLGATSVISLKFIFIHGIWDGRSEIDRGVLEVSSLVFGNLISIVLRISVCLWFIISQVANSVASTSTSYTLKTTSNKFLWIQLLQTNAPRLFFFPFVVIISMGVLLRFCVRFLISGGVEASIIDAINSGVSITKSQQLLELNHGIRLVLFRELGLAAFAGLIVAFSARVVLRSGVMRQAKHT